MIETKLPPDYLHKLEVAEDYLGIVDLKICSDRKQYRKKHGGDIILFDSFIYTRNHLLWYGDFHWELQKGNILNLAFKLKDEVYVFNFDRVNHKDVLQVPDFHLASIYIDGKYQLESAHQLSTFAGEADTQLES